MDIAMIGLGRMGGNMARRLLRGGHRVVLYDRAAEAGEKIKTEDGGEVAASYSDVAAKLKAPRHVWLMLPAGEVTELALVEFMGLLSPDDTIIDGGNSNYKDTQRRYDMLKEKGLNYVDVGTSGGIWGFANGYGMMIGGDKAAVDRMRPIFESLAPAPDQGWGHMGPSGAGHYVKMVHNGIEYGDMQLIAEAYFIMKNALNLDARRLHDVFAEWDEGELNSYLIEITRDIFARKDEDTGQALVEVILDKAGQKGTGKWASQSALDLGICAPTIAEAVFARCISAIKDERVAASKVLRGPSTTYGGDQKTFVEAIRQALYASKICSYAQGFALMREAGREYGWELDFGEIAKIWRGGCIIRARFLHRITEAYQRDPKLANLMLDPFFKDILEKAQENWRHVAASALTLGYPIPAFSSALAYFDSYRRASLPANLIQAQRDYFGAHTYERIDKPGKFHTEWTK
jgi:6-phosphogluconate dehydrogenase